MIWPFSSIIGVMLFVWVVALVVMWLIAARRLSGPDLTHFDDPAAGQTFAQHPDDEAANQQLSDLLRSFRKSLKSSRSIRSGFARAREFADTLSDDLITESTFKAVECNGVKCEWTIATGADETRRILFMHGGAFFLGSPRGHRRMTDKLSKLANAAVLSVDYRMLPEHGRHKGIVDCQAAYRWVLENGPTASSTPSLLLVAGDSAGGNLALMLSSWSKDAKLRRPDGVIGFSPSTDVTMTSPTLLSNRATDPVLREGVGALLKIPGPIRAWVGLVLGRANPANPLLSPLLYDLKDLPRTLIHASSSEMLLGESIRYTNKARAAGSEVTLQVWENQVHDWHLFNMDVGSGKAAWLEIEKFVQSL